MFKITCFFVYILFVNAGVFAEIGITQKSQIVSESQILDEFNALSDNEQCDIILQSIKDLQNKVRNPSGYENETYSKKIVNEDEILNKLNAIATVIEKSRNQFSDDWKVETEFPENNLVDFPAEDEAQDGMFQLDESDMEE